MKICNILSYTRTQKKRHDFEMEAFSLTLNISAESLSNIKTKGSFGILRTSRFQNYPWLLDLTKNWQRYWGLKRRLPFQNHGVFFKCGCTLQGLTGVLNYLHCKILKNFKCYEKAILIFCIETQLTKCYFFTIFVSFYSLI